MRIFGGFEISTSPSSGMAKEDNVWREYYFVGTLKNNGVGMAKMLRYVMLRSGSVGVFSLWVPIFASTFMPPNPHPLLQDLRLKILSFLLHQSIMSKICSSFIIQSCKFI